VDDSTDFRRLERRLARERAARIEAESIAERVTADQFAAMNELIASRSVLDETPDFVAITDPQGRASYLNLALREMLGAELADVRQVQIADLLTPVSRERYEREALPALSAKGVWRGEFALTRPSGGEIPVSQVLIGHKDEAGAMRHISFVARDVTEQRDITDALAHLSLHDALTGLPNRRLLFDRLDMAVARAASSGTALAVLFMDLDGFKLVNDNHGHAVGDAVLIAVIERMQSVMRASDTLARVGGDEFVLLCESVSGEREAKEIAGRLTDMARQPVEVLGVTASVGLSVGIAYSQLPGSSPDVLVRRADAAMYDAKRAGKGTHRLVVVDD
jgi:diguanylate cyclase (GGDEF)-like protein/PAS domain S-box-containing protein